MRRNAATGSARGQEEATARGEPHAQSFASLLLLPAFGYRLGEPEDTLALLLGGGRGGRAPRPLLWPRLRLGDDWAQRRQAADRSEPGFDWEGRSGGGEGGATELVERVLGDLALDPEDRVLGWRTGTLHHHRLDFRPASRERGRWSRWSRSEGRSSQEPAASLGDFRLRGSDRASWARRQQAGKHDRPYDEPATTEHLPSTRRACSTSRTIRIGKTTNARAAGVPGGSSQPSRES